MPLEIVMKVRFQKSDLFSRSNGSGRDNIFNVIIVSIISIILDKKMPE